MGTFDRNLAIKNDYIHFYAPGDEIFDCIVNNAMHSCRGMSTAFCTLSSFDWKGFVYTYSIEPNERVLIDQGVSLYALNQFRQYLSSPLQIVPVAFESYSEIPDEIVVDEHRKICSKGFHINPKKMEALGKRSKTRGLLNIGPRCRVSNIEWFKAQFEDERWKKLVSESMEISYRKAVTQFNGSSDLEGAKDMIEQLLSTQESRERYYGTSNKVSIEELEQEYELIYSSLQHPVVRLEAACFMWLVKSDE